MRVPSHLKKRYGDLIKQIIKIPAAKKRGRREYREPGDHTRLK